MPVPTDGSTKLTDLAQQRLAMGGGSGGGARAARPQLTSRACSYQDTSRYRSAGANPLIVPVTGTASQTPAVKDDRPAGLVGHDAPPSSSASPAVTASTAAARNPSAPFSATNRPILTRGFTRDAWVKQLASGNGIHPGSGANTPQKEHPLMSGAASVWGPASPSLTGSFSIVQDVVGSPNAPVPIQSFAFTIHADRHLSATSRPGTPTTESGDPMPESVTATADRFKEGQSQLESTPATGRTIMVAIDGTDTDGLATLDWACESVVQPGDTLIVVRVVRELKGFKGGYAAASDMLMTIERRARQEGDRVTCHALRKLGRTGKKCVDLHVKYRVGEPRAAIRDLVSHSKPSILIVGGARQRIAKGPLAPRPTPGTPLALTGASTNVFFHGGKGTFVPEDMKEQVEILTAQ
ncbi:hypothetical protein HKX48_007742 [Thoreauomyces humboldtii]|nr:hypothetical protein HKX48_007742 [Thoreauomyces humboldtii]